MMAFRFFFIQIVSLLLTATAAFGHIGHYDAKIEALLQQPTRPTMSEFLDALNYDVSKPNPFPRKTNFPRAVALADVPRIIAVLEKFFPGGTYVSMGRDSVNITDMLEAYYLSIGETNRTGRLEVSTASFPIPQDTLIQYLKQLGLSTDAIGFGSHPVVVMDRTGFRPASQSTQIENSVKAFLGQDYAKRFAMATTHILHSKSLKNIEQYFEKTNRIGLETGFSDLTAWHDSYGQLSVIDSKVIPSPGRVFSRDNLITVLSDMYEMASMVKSSAFISAIKEYEKHYEVSKRKLSLDNSSRKKNYDSNEKTWRQWTMDNIVSMDSIEKRQRPLEKVLGMPKDIKKIIADTIVENGLDTYLLFNNMRSAEYLAKSLDLFAGTIYEDRQLQALRHEYHSFQERVTSQAEKLTPHLRSVLVDAFLRLTLPPYGEDIHKMIRAIQEPLLKKSSADWTPNVERFVNRFFDVFHPDREDVLRFLSYFKDSPKAYAPMYMKANKYLKVGGYKSSDGALVPLKNVPLLTRIGIQTFKIKERFGHGNACKNFYW